ncbi:hypothetical protein EHO57_14025 [Leptospira langatensis]|uniref:COMM domain-containing protein n=1 Tax=Leptospira langatensis TaxID=2484983 RepID=A0A5R2ATJ4_9LEPT|nr:hypothetical protein [Leptospira langatensis]TGJ99872.1 hypothetical protein EHO57_14025 [Leptospira langatensis]
MRTVRVQPFDDLQLLSEQSDANLEKIAEYLNRNEIATSGQLAQYLAFCASLNIDEKVAKIFLNLVGFLGDWVTEQKGFEEAFASFEQAFFSGKPETLNVEIPWERTKNFVKTLEPYIVLRKRAQKTHVLSTLQKFNLTTEIRPIFDIHRVKVIENLYVTILSIEGTEGETLFFDLTEQELSKMQREIEFALQKIEALKGSLPRS